MAPMLHALATHYHTDPWTVLHEWPLGRYDLNAFVLRIALEEERRALEKAARRRL